MPYKRKDGTETIGAQTVIDDLTYRTDLSRQRKWQIRKRRQCGCVRCGAPLTPRNRIRHGKVELTYPEKCDKCRDADKARKKGALQGREERIERTNFSIEDTCD